MYKPSVDLCEHAFVVIWIVTQEFASLFWKSALTCISWTQPRAASKRDGWDIIETTRGQQVRQSLEMKPFPTFHFGPQKQRKTVMKKKAQQRFSPRCHRNPSSGNSLLGKSCHRPALSSSCPFLQWAWCSKTWKCWSLDKMIERLHHREHKCKHYPWVCYFALKVQHKPFYSPPNHSFVGVFVLSFFLFFLFFHKSTYNKICTERS